jgi:hypothetical protein
MNKQIPARYGFFLAFWILLAAAFVARCAGLNGDLWLDEIWAIKTIQRFHSLWQIITTSHEINHPLYSLYIYWLSDSSPPWRYRLLSLMSGLATVWLAGLIGRRQWLLVEPRSPSSHADTACLLTAAIAGGSYLLIHYSSEARGYSLAVMLSFLAWYALLRGNGNRRIGWQLTYGLSAVLAIASHVTAVSFLAAGIIWTMASSWTLHRSWKSLARRTAFWHGIPAMIVAAYYFFLLRHREIGGAEVSPLINVVSECAAYTLGFPVGKTLIVALPIAALLLAASLIFFMRANRSLAAFYIMAVFIAPLLLITCTHYQYPYPRHFIINAAFCLLALGTLLTKSALSGLAGRTACVVLLTFFFVGNAAHVADLSRYGRGAYRQALEYAVRITPTRYVTFAGDHDFRNLMVISYYVKNMTTKQDVIYFPQDPNVPWPSTGVQWFFVHRFDANPAPDSELRDRWGHIYTFVKLFPYCGLSGWNWLLYRNSTALEECHEK